MGSSGFETERRPEVEHTSLTNLFEKYCPIYMSYGMPYEAFWHGDAYEVIFYKKAHMLKLQQQDENNWMLGTYIYEIILKCSPILRAFSKKDAKALPYSDKPHLFETFRKMFLTPEQKKAEEEERKQQELLKARIHFNNWFNAVAKKFENK